MSAYLLENKPRQTQFRDRKGKPSGLIEIHTAESPADTVGPDAGAENVANFIRNRSDFGSYHVICDSDSRIRLVPFEMAAYGDGTGSNDFAIHLSIAASAHQWSSLPQAWKNGAIRQMARAAANAIRWLKTEHGITVPLRRISKADSDKRKAGFIAHGDRDPGRRTDPGRNFPWDLLFKFIAEELAPKKPASKPAPKPAPKPQLKKSLDIEVVLANIKNGGGQEPEDLSRAQVRADARAARLRGDVGLLQEIFEYNDWEDVRDSVKPFRVTSSHGTGQAGTKKRSTTIFWDPGMFDLVQELTHAYPGFNPDVKGGAVRYLKEVQLRPKGTSLPVICFFDEHRIHGAWGGDRQLATPQRRKWWAEQQKFANMVATNRVKMGMIVVGGGDLNRSLEEITWPAGSKPLIGDRNSAQIDGAYILAPAGVEVKDFPDEKFDRVNSDHAQRASRVRLTKK